MTDKSMSPVPLLVTIDGPAGAGKTTVSRRLADALGYKYIDTGALYRAVALAAKRAGVATDDDPGLGKICAQLTLRFQRTADGATCLMMGGEDISGLIRTPEMSMMASAVSARPVVRACLLAVQKAMGREKAAVFEGRDMGTVVFPEAEVKFFLDADAEVRARRRYRELGSGTTVSLDDVARDLVRRDHNDSTRAIAPLKPAKDAVVIDSTGLSIDQVVERMQRHVLNRAGAGV